MNHQKKLIKYLSAILVLFLCIGTKPIVHADDGFPLTVKVYNPDDGSTSDKTFTSGDELLGNGIHQNAGRNNWSYRTFRKVFFGWSLDPKYANSAAVNNMSMDDKIYRDIETISDLMAENAIDENTILYPIIMPVSDLATLMLSMANGGGECFFDVSQPDDQIFEKNNLIKDSSGFNDLTATERKIVSYFDENTQTYGLKGTYEFRYSDPRTPALIIENPLAALRSARGITDFSGVSPTNYTYSDIHIVIDADADVSTTQKDWKFSSSTFMVAAVLDNAGNTLTMTSLTQPDAHSLDSVFTFENPNKLHEFVIRTILRNDNGDSAYGANNYPSNNIITINGRDLLKPMTLHSGDFSNMSISKEKAKTASLDQAGAVQFSFSGFVNGQISVDKTNFTGGAALIGWLLPNNQVIGRADSKNITIIDFEPVVVRFDRNSLSLGDTAIQDIGYSRVALNGAMNSDTYNEDKQPNLLTNMGDTFSNLYALNDRVIFNGQSAYFLGWNTKADGSGDYVDDATVFDLTLLHKDGNADLVLYAQWKNKFKASHSFVSLTPHKTLPSDVTNLLPGDVNDLTDGSVVNAVGPSQNVVTVHEGKWIFKGYTPSSETINGTDVLFEGKWEFEPNGAHVTPSTPSYVVPPTSAQ